MNSTCQQYYALQSNYQIGQRLLATPHLLFKSYIIINSIEKINKHIRIIIMLSLLVCNQGYQSYNYQFILCENQMKQKLISISHYIKIQNYNKIVICLLKISIIMQVTQIRSSSRKSNRCSRDSPDLKQKSTQLVSAKIGDFSQRNQTTTCSRQLQSRKSKNPTDNTEYIRNLYKKYLGKENNNNSQRKTRTDVKDIKLQKVVMAEQHKQKLNYYQEPPQLHKIQSAAERPSNTNPNLFRKLSNMQEVKTDYAMKIHQSCSKPACANFYPKLLDDQTTNIIGNQKCSLVLAMQTINAIRKKYR